MQADQPAPADPQPAGGCCIGERHRAPRVQPQQRRGQGVEHGIGGVMHGHCTNLVQLRRLHMSANRVPAGSAQVDPESPPCACCVLPPRCCWLCCRPAARSRPPRRRRARPWTGHRPPLRNPPPPRLHPHRRLSPRTRLSRPSRWSRRRRCWVRSRSGPGAPVRPRRRPPSPPARRRRWPPPAGTPTIRRSSPARPACCAHRCCCCARTIPAARSTPWRAGTWPRRCAVSRRRTGSNPAASWMPRPGRCSTRTPPRCWSSTP